MRSLYTTLFLLLAIPFTVSGQACGPGVTPLNVNQMVAALTADSPYAAGQNIKYCFNTGTTIISDVQVRLTYDTPDPAAVVIVQRFSTRTTTVPDTLSANGATTLLRPNTTYTVEVDVRAMGHVDIGFAIPAFGNFPIGNTLVCVEQLLPVTWMAPLTATVQGKRTRLDWSVGNQIDVARYEVEMATDGIFSTLQQVGVKDREGEIFYDAYVATPDVETAYRIRQTDFDGSYSFSNVVIVAGSRDTGLGVYPNPATDALNVSGLSRDFAESLDVHDARGRLVRRFSPNLRTLPIADLPKGTYLLRAGNEAVRFVK